MSTSEQGAEPTQGGMTRREIVSALARWTVPTVVTLSLGARAAQAAASCPPCTRKQVSGSCRACTIQDILTCNCEPCLGAPYCSGARTGTSAYRPSLQGASGPAPLGQQALESELRRRAALRRNELLPGFGRSGFGSRTDSIFGGSSAAPYGRTRDPLAPRPLPGRTPSSSSLYDRLRTFERRR